MRPTRRGKILGIAVGERMALVAEVSSTGGRAVVHHVGEFHYPAGMDLAHPDLLGRALGDFLGEQGITSRSVVFGVPGKWVLSMPMQAPPAAPDLIADTLRLQAEGEFAADGGDFTYDYTGETSSSEARTVLLMAMARRQLDAVTSIATAAHLKAIAVTPFAVTLGAVGGRMAKPSRVLLIGPAGAEFVAHGGGHAQSLKYLGPSSSTPAFLAGELRRAGIGGGSGPSSAGFVAGVSGNGAAGGELLLWNDARLEASVLRAMGESFGGPYKLGEPQALGVVGSSSNQAPAGYATAVSLALAGLDVVRLPINFLHSRLDVKPQPRIPRRTLIIGGAVAAVLLLGLWGYSDMSSRQAQVDTLVAREKAEEKRVKEASESVKKISFAEGWHHADPTFVDCMNDLTAALPEDGRAFITSFTMNGEFQGKLIGRAREDIDVLALADRLGSTKRFIDVTQQYTAAPRPSTSKKPAAGPTPGPTPSPAPGPTPAPQGGPPPGALPPGMSPEQAQAMAMAMKARGMPEGMQLPPNMTPEQAQQLAMAMQQRGGIPPGAMPQVGPPPGAMPAGPQPERPPKGERPPKSDGGAAAPAAGAGELTFSMTFNYVPRKK